MIRKISWLVTLGALVAAVVAVPALGATESQTSKLVQIGGRLVPPSQVSSTERQLSSAWLAANGSSGSSSHVGRDLGIGLGTAALLAAALLIVAAATRRRHRLTTA
jgi:LysM repeat protein